MDPDSTVTNETSSNLVKRVPIQTIIEAETGWQLIDWRELWRYRDLFFFLVWRDVKTRYAQSILGIGWAIIQPLLVWLCLQLYLAT